MHIRALRDSDIERVAAIHYEELPEDFCSLLGFAFLRRVFYPELLKVCEVKLGAFDEQDVVQGFILFTTDETLYRRLATRHVFRVLRHIDWRVFLRPKFLRYVLEVLVLIFSKDRRLHGAELVYVAVAKTQRGKGVGTTLIGDGLNQLKQKGIRWCWLKTLSSTPQNVRLYEKVGFTLCKTYLGRVYMVTEIA